MRPGHFAPDYEELAVDECADECVASMRPGHFAPDYAPSLPTIRTAFVPASMRPGHFAPDYLAKPKKDLKVVEELQ